MTTGCSSASSILLQVLDGCLTLDAGFPAKLFDGAGSVRHDRHAFRKYSLRARHRFLFFSAFIFQRFSSFRAPWEIRIIRCSTLSTFANPTGLAAARAHPSRHCHLAGVRRPRRDLRRDPEPLGCAPSRAVHLRAVSDAVAQTPTFPVNVASLPRSSCALLRRWAAVTHISCFVYSHAIGPVGFSRGSWNGTPL